MFTGHLLPLYNSLLHDLQTSGIDALAQKNWNQHLNWVNPPFFILGKVIDLIIQQKAQATIIAPLWPAQPWFHKLKRLLIAPPIQLPNHHNVFRSSNPDINPEPRKNQHLCLESLWRDKLSSQGWSERVVRQFPLAWSKSTISAYNRVINKFFKFCSAKLLTFPPCNSDVIAEFPCTIADDSHRPQSQRNTTKAALSHLYDCYDIPCPADGKDITLFISALIKSQTQHTMKKSTVMPIYKLTLMFLKWPEDSELSIKDLRLKCIAL